MVAVEEASVETAEAVGEAAGATLEDGEAVVSEAIEVEVEVSEEIEAVATEAIEAEVEVVVDSAVEVDLAVVPASHSRSSRKLKAPV